MKSWSWMVGRAMSIRFFPVSFPISINFFFYLPIYFVIYLFSLFPIPPTLLKTLVDTFNHFIQFLLRSKIPKENLENSLLPSTTQPPPP